MLWIVLTVLVLLALAIIGWPLYRHAGKLTPTLAGVIIFTVASSAGLYHYLGSPGVPSGAGSAPDVSEMVTALAERLDDNPDDVNGWIMLGRSYQTLGQLDNAVAAFEKAIALEEGRNPQTLVALGLALMAQQNGQLTDRAVSLFENALALDPNNPNALFYAGGAAAQRGDTALAADRWEILAGLNTPPEIRELLQNKISEWRGVPPKPVEQLSSVLTIAVSASDAAMAAVSTDATVFIIARDPSQPSPPVAVARRRLSELPAVVELSDRDAMIPGRPLSGFSQVELVARVSVSGAPAAQPGDWFNSIVIDRAETASDGSAIDLVIDKIVQ